MKSKPSCRAESGGGLLLRGCVPWYDEGDVGRASRAAFHSFSKLELLQKRVVSVEQSLGQRKRAYPMDKPFSYLAPPAGLEPATQ